MAGSRPRILFSISSLGLGHATRTLSIIRAYLPSHDVHVISSRNALELLRQELGKRATYYDVKDYPPLQRGSGWRHYMYLGIDLIVTIFVIRSEHSFITELAHTIQPDAIISDGRYGSYVAGIPSFLVVHQVSFAMPKGFGFFRGIIDRLNRKAFSRFDALFIPDYADPVDNLAGELSHHSMLSSLPHYYVGILSSMQKHERKRDIDILFNTGGFLASNKPGLTDVLLDEARKLHGKKVFVLGNTNGETHHTVDDPTIEIIPFVFGDARHELFNRARFIVTRGGYTTVMDLVELGIRALLIPTSGQTEQEYLAQHLSRHERFLALSGDEISLTDEHFAQPLRAFDPKWKTKESIKRITEVVARATQKRFFSFIIPAHNEEKYISATLESIAALHYPADRFEVIVVENGSTDRTREVAEKALGENGRVYVSGHGVSKARNFGLKQISKESDWTIFLDADTILKPDFLRDMDRYFHKHRRDNISVGTTEVMPLENTGFKAHSWFGFYNWGHKLTKTSFAIFFVRSSLCGKLRFDESIYFAEDLKFLKDAQQYGKFGYIETKSVLTSTRRFDAVGWFKQFIVWNWEALVLARSHRRARVYRVIR